MDILIESLSYVLPSACCGFLVGYFIAWIISDKKNNSNIYLYKKNSYNPCNFKSYRGNITYHSPYNKNSSYSKNYCKSSKTDC